MAESKSKLKRKKPSVGDRPPEICSRGTLNRTWTTMFPSDGTSEPERSMVPAAEWWRREQLPAVESCWALTLKSALLYLENQHCDLVPDLLCPSIARPTSPKLDDQRWCDLREEVASFPEPALPLQRTASSPGPLRLCLSQHDPSVQTKVAPDPPDRPLPSHTWQSLNDKTTSLQAFTKRPQPSHNSWEAVASSTSVGREEERKEKETDKQICLEKKGKNKEKLVDEEEEVQRSGGEAAGGGTLQSCPMCLLVFPAGFSQMDCDSHLAQCLSEVNMDMTW
ncbi:uncharacterized protein si:ch73-70k4.1 isoform X2 [Sparus aurata]|uniref:uncharacterized protein si:ch73-70k4.1 isoform X2 n=1 Tax=Sparus aurata TaxID=8175 RepID=UPI0011C1007D|nr:Fanconi anemia core complex-associated protein 20 isoform X2 [Sparus aurata]